MSEIFRAARSDEVPAAARLMMHSFPGLGRSAAGWESTLAANPLGSWEDLWLGEVDGAVTGACMIYRFQQWIGGARLPVAGVGAVAIAPTHRRRGLAARMVLAGLRAARERGEVASALYPFRTAFYQRMGYGQAGEAHLYRVPPEVFPDHPERRSVRMARPEGDDGAIRGVYDAWIRGQTGQIERGPGAWQAMWESGAYCAAYWSPEGNAEGYVVFRYQASGGRTQRFVEVAEAVWLTPAAQRGIYGWLSSLGDQWRIVSYAAHPEEGLDATLAEPRMEDDGSFRWGLWFPAAVLLHGPMFRLLDVPRAWEARTVRSDCALTLALEVHDEALPENGGSWRLRMEDGAVAPDHAAGAADLKLSATVDVVSRIFIGALTPSEAVRLGVAHVASPERLPELDGALRLPRPWTFERF